MSYIRLNIMDKNQTISGEVHGFFGDALVASLAAEPEDVGELELALARFIKTESGLSLFHGFAKHENFEPYDAGVLVVDLAARVVAVDSSYSMLSAEGSVRVQSDFAYDDEDIIVPYHLSDDWLFVYSIPEYEGVCRERRERRLALKPFDAREVLYGRALSEFIARECFEARDSDDEELFTRIHAKWLMTARDDLQGKMPREILLEKRDFIDFDLHSRELQWSFTKACPPPLSSSSNAYLSAGFGTQEIVVYYYLVRYLLTECFEQDEPNIETLERLKNRWLNDPCEEFSGRVPSRIIDSERRRVNLTMSAHECIVDEDCEICQMMAAEFNTPMFWHLDGCNMDEGFEFSFHKTLEEYEAEQREWEEFNKKFEEDRKAGKYDKPFDFSLIDFEDDDDNDNVPF